MSVRPSIGQSTGLTNPRQPSFASHSLTCGSRAGAVALLDGQGYSCEAEIDLENRVKKEREEKKGEKEEEKKLDRRFSDAIEKCNASLSFLFSQAHTSACVEAGSMLGRPQPACHL